MKAQTVIRIVNRKRYSTQTATLIASDVYWDGNNFERNGRNEFLYKTPKGNFFLVTQSCWQGEDTTLEPITQDEAIRLYEKSLPVHEVEYEIAFEGVTVEEA